MSSIKAVEIEFSKIHAFRKFKDLKIPLSPRITLLCGHNGVGKSTILGLLSSLSGITSALHKSYFGKKFDASIADIIYIDHSSEVAAPKTQNTLAEPLIHYTVNGTQLTKVCSLTRRKNAARARVVPRNSPYKPITAGNLRIGKDAKIPLPTIFLGMIRMLPVGESPSGRVQNNVGMSWHVDDEQFMLDFVKRVIPGAGAKSGAIAVNRISQTRKLSTHPSYPYDTKSVSLGQDSLGAIVTALASFRKIKRSLGNDYVGGILIIDELDAGFHPHAIGTLVNELREIADELELQIIATTHSTRLIEAVHPQGESKTAAGKDSVVYLKNTKAPEFSPNMGLLEILRDMSLTPPPAKKALPELKVYFEDDEACEVFNWVTTKQLLNTLGDKYGVSIKPMPLGVGCSSLAKLPTKDPYFKEVVLAVDADGKPTKNSPSNLVSLPGEIDAQGNALSPERTIIKYIRALVNEPKANHPLAWSDPRLKDYSTDSLEANLLQGLNDLLNRKEAKAWWQQKREMLKSWGLYQIWIKANRSLITQFESELDLAVKSASKAQRTREYQLKFGKNP